MVLLKSLAIVAAMLMAWVVNASQESAPADSSAINSSLRVDHREVHPDPALPSNDGWARIVIEVILLGFFLPAAIIGRRFPSCTPRRSRAVSRRRNTSRDIPDHPL
jgi:hypothetical protein